MGIRDGFRKFMNFIKGVKSLPEAQENQPEYINRVDNSSKTHILTREDGSQIKLTPILDELGNQAYKQVYNRTTCQMQAIPKFNVVYDEEITCEGTCIFNRDHEMYMDIDPKLITDTKYADFIANVMLAEERLKKIEEKYGGYVGTIVEENGELEKRISRGIVDTLKAEKAENARRVEEDMRRKWTTEREEEARQIREKAQNLPCYNKFDKEDSSEQGVYR